MQAAETTPTTAQAQAFKEFTNESDASLLGLRNSVRDSLNSKSAITADHQKIVNIIGRLSDSSDIVGEIRMLATTSREQLLRQVLDMSLSALLELKFLALADAELNRRNSGQTVNRT